MDPRKLMARLNPSSPRMPSGRKGRGTTRAARRIDLAIELFTQYRDLGARAPTRCYTPMQTRSPPRSDTLNAETIVGALGMVEEDADPGMRLGREVFLRCWWPDGARLAVDQLRSSVLAIIMPEYDSRRAAVRDKELQLSIIKSSDAARTCSNAIISRGVATAEHELRVAKVRAWPEPSERYLLVIDCVLVELAAPTICPDCKGTGMTGGEAGRDKCVMCQGTGYISISERTRAQLMQIDWKNYRTVGWQSLYRWVYDHLSMLQSRYRSHLAMRMGLRDVE